MCDVATAPTISAILSLSGPKQHLLKLFFRYAALLCAYLLNAQPKDPGPFRQVVNVAAGCKQFRDISMLQGDALIRRNVESIAVGIFVAPVGFAVFCRIEGKAHL